jgi:hypothetical protein
LLGRPLGRCCDCCSDRRVGAWDLENAKCRAGVGGAHDSLEAGMKRAPDETKRGLRSSRHRQDMMGVYGVRRARASRCCAVEVLR